MKKSKIIFLSIVTLLSVIIFSLNSDTVISSVKHSLFLCYSSVIPALFPFFVLSEFLTSLLGCINVNPTFFSFISGLITGFPTGTKNVCSLYSGGVIDKKTAVTLLHSTANASPAYVISFIGICMIGSKSAGIILFIAQIITSLICALSLKSFKKNKSSRISIINLTDVACKSVTGSVSSCLYICGYIVFMGVIADIVIHYDLHKSISELFSFLPQNTVESAIIGVIEITRGISAIDFESKYAILTAAFIIGFSGISVILQCINCTRTAKLPASPIIKGKLIYSVLMPLITYCLLKIVPVTFGKHSNIFGSTIFAIFILFLAVFLYIIFDKSYKRLYNK